MSRRRGLLAIAAAASVAASPAAAADIRGVWQGSVGDLPVRACFTRGDSGPFGAYYYRSRGKLILLETAGPNAFGEGKADGPRWALDSWTGGPLSGRWTSGARTLPIRLTRLAGSSADEEPCASLLFHQPRLEGLKVVPSPAAVRGVRYTRLVLDTAGRFPTVSVETFEVPGSTEPVRRLNRILRAPLSKPRPEWLDCVSAPLQFHPSEGDFEQRLVPTLFSKRWLAVEDQQDSFCGGPHPNAGTYPRTFDLSTGREIRLQIWLNAKAVRPIPGGQDVAGPAALLPAFRAFILRGYKEEAECDGVVKTEEFWNIALTRTGFVFSPDLAHVVQACGDAFAIPFARLQPWLSAEGARNAAALIAERPGG